MSAPSSPNAEPGFPNRGGGFVRIINVVILVCPIAALAAGAGAFIGMSVAVAWWGNEFLRHGAVAGAGAGVLLVIVWAAVVAGRAQASTKELQAHAEKLAAYFQDMKGRGIGTDDPVFHLLWRLGLKVPPPVFLGACGSFCYPFGVFAPMVLTGGAVLWWGHPNYSLWSIWASASLFLLAAVGLGIYSVKATRARALKLQLPSWDQYVPAPITGIAETSTEGKPL